MPAKSAHSGRVETGPRSQAEDMGYEATPLESPLCSDLVQ